MGISLPLLSILHSRLWVRHVGGQSLHSIHVIRRRHCFPVCVTSMRCTRPPVRTTCKQCARNTPRKSTARSVALHRRFCDCWQRQGSFHTVVLRANLEFRYYHDTGFSTVQKADSICQVRCALMYRIWRSPHPVEAKSYI